MSVLVDEETVVIDDLDFTVACEALRRGVDRCEEEATHQAICRECGNVTCVVCIDHAIWARRSERRLIHRGCGARGRVCDLVEVVPL